MAATKFELEIGVLESEWSEGGFFWEVRQGRFAATSFERALTRLAAISLPDGTDLPRRLVSLLWFIPIFMQWQTGRVRDTGGDTSAYGKATTLMTNEIERLLGVP